MPYEEKLFEFISYAYKHQIKPDEKFFGISRVRAYQIVEEASEEDNMTYKKISPHLFRHEFTVNYLLCGGLMPNLKTLMGHSSILTRLVYLRLTQADIRQDIEKIVF